MTLFNEDRKIIGEHEAYWFLNSLITFVAGTEDTEGAFQLFRQVMPAGFATPYHTHAAYGEGFQVLSGEVTVFCDGVQTVLRDGGFIYLPGAKPHGFRVTSEGSTSMLIISPPKSSFGDFVREMGEPVVAGETPAPAPPDFSKLAALSAKYGSTILGPLPG